MKKGNEKFVYTLLTLAAFAVGLYLLLTSDAKSGPQAGAGVVVLLVGLGLSVFKSYEVADRVYGDFWSMESYNPDFRRKARIQGWVTMLIIGILLNPVFPPLFHTGTSLFVGLGSLVIAIGLFVWWVVGLRYPEPS